MNPKEHVPLAPLTTFHIGGQARFFVEAQTEKEIDDAVIFARDRHLSLCTLGGGSNVLVPDTGVEGFVLRVAIEAIAFETDGDNTVLVAGAGTSWDAIVTAVAARGVFGIENLAGIPGTLGGAAVQNVGAYGAELANVFAYADAIHRATGEYRRIMASEASFAYRTSFFKKQRDYIITRVALRFAPDATPNLSYPDLARAHASGESLTTPTDIARLVRAIRSQKFPNDSEEGTAGSFFKNPIISRVHADSLTERFPGLPTFAQGSDRAKIPLAWLLDHALSLKGYAIGPVRLYEKQPLVIVARAGATASAVDTFASDISERVRTATGITLEREVETFDERFFS